MKKKTEKTLMDKSFPHFPQVFPQAAICGVTVNLVYINLHEVNIISPNFLPHNQFDNSIFLAKKLPLDKRSSDCTMKKLADPHKIRNFFEKGY